MAKLIFPPMPFEISSSNRAMDAVYLQHNTLKDAKTPYQLPDELKKHFIRYCSSINLGRFTFDVSKTDSLEVVKKKLGNNFTNAFNTYKEMFKQQAAEFEKGRAGISSKKQENEDPFIEINKHMVILRRMYENKEDRDSIGFLERWKYEMKKFKIAAEKIPPSNPRRPEVDTHATSADSMTRDIVKEITRKNVEELKELAPEIQKWCSARTEEVLKNRKEWDAVVAKYEKIWGRMPKHHSYKTKGEALIRKIRVKQERIIEKEQETIEYRLGKITSAYNTLQIEAAKWYDRTSQVPKWESAKKEYKEAVKKAKDLNLKITSEINGIRLMNAKDAQISILRQTEKLEKAFFQRASLGSSELEKLKWYRSEHQRVRGGTLTERWAKKEEEMDAAIKELEAVSSSRANDDTGERDDDMKEFLRAVVVDLDNQTYKGKSGEQWPLEDAPYILLEAGGNSFRFPPKGYPIEQYSNSLILSQMSDDGTPLPNYFGIRVTDYGGAHHILWNTAFAAFRIEAQGATPVPSSEF